MKAHPESLLNIPLVKNLLSYPMFERAVDHHWFYQKAAPSTMSGFQPFSGKIYYGKNSYFSQWLKNPEKSARNWNVNDNLIKEVMFAVHDSLHIWAVGAIQKLQPELGFGTKPITANNFEDFVFCHLLTEAVAVCGLDYWYLARVDINSICDIGTNFRNLTVNFHEGDLSEFQKFSPSFRVQRKDFLWDLTKFYCTGTFEGFAVEDLKRSPKLLTWLSHELRYGQNQRKYARDWFTYLSVDKKIQNFGEESVSVVESWKESLTKKIANLLWERVRGKKGVNFYPIQGRSSWRSSLKKKADYRFINLNSCVDELSAPRLEDFDFYFYQEMVSRDFHSFPAEKADLLEETRNSKDWRAVKKLFRSLPKVSTKKEPRDLFVLP